MQNLNWLFLLRESSISSLYVHPEYVQICTVWEMRNEDVVCAKIAHDQYCSRRGKSWFVIVVQTPLFLGICLRSVVVLSCMYVVVVYSQFSGSR